MKNTMKDARLENITNHRVNRKKTTLFACLVFLLSIGNSACDSVSGDDSLSNLEAVPYAALGQGKVVFERIDSNERASIYVIDADNGNTTGFSFSRSDASPLASPDGQTIAYRHTFPRAQNENTRTALYLTDIDGRNTRQAPEEWMVGDHFNWTPDGSGIVSLVYTGDVEGPGESIRAIAVQPIAGVRTPAELIVDLPSLSRYLCSFNLDPWSISPTGEVLLTTWRCNVNQLDIRPPSGLYLAESNPDTLKIVVEMSDEIQRTIHSPTWAPNGRRIAYIEYWYSGTGTDWKMAVRLIDSDGQNLETIVEATSSNPNVCCWNDHAITWSPDGSRLAFNNYDELFSSHIYVVDKDGSNLTKITSKAGVTDRSISWVR